MNKEDIIRKTEDFVMNAISGHDSGHDWWHIDRVRRLAMDIHSQEGQGNGFAVELSALLHDIDDKKFTDRNDNDTGRKLNAFLSGMGVGDVIINLVTDININISFSSGRYEGQPPVEFKIVQDADRLDAMGAIGIARAFHYGGFRNNCIYDPDGIKSSTVGHFYDKLLSLRNLMNTRSGRIMAEERHLFLERFLDQFYREWNS